MEKKIVTDKEAVKAMNTLIDYCDWRRACNDCVIKKQCKEIQEIITYFGGLERINEAEKLPNKSKVEKLARAMAASIMNRKD